VRLQPETRWYLLPRPDLIVERSAEPQVLKLDDAVDWIKRNKPLLWVGSIFSVPEPSRFPSGYALTRSLLDLLFPAEEHAPEPERDRMIDSLMPHWPLEAEHDGRASPNPLHDAITRYYERGLSGTPLCVTTNWDTLIEKAFRSKGYKVHTAGPAKMPADDFGKPDGSDRTISVYHPHGSFETVDVVCSSFQEQQQLALHIGFKYRPMLFLGYSGYEPSLYRHLEYSGPHLWCIRNERDLDVPAKRRLLCRRGTQVFVGDMLELLRALQVLDQDVSLTTSYLGLEGQIPPEVIEVIHVSIAARIEPRFCSDFLADALCSDYPEPELTFRLSRINSALTITSGIAWRPPNCRWR
jgi:hypothetical protein